MSSSLEEVVDPDETIALMVHRHPLSLVFPLFSALLVGMVGIFIFYVLGRFPEQLEKIGPLSMVALAGAAVIVLALILIVANLRIYARNGLVLTDKTLYLIGQTSLINRDSSQFALNKLEDVKAIQSGLLGTVFNYGEVVAKTAGAEDNMVFKWAPRPQSLAEAILDANEKVK
ncbi:MAG TPA: hypothetical protein VMR98_00170 [Candidatus Polarisedimenticolaceae bacterium]|nr:hypothetical protein [Candidatus Polarisedimenticolaceae bacterium]